MSFQTGHASVEYEYLAQTLDVYRIAFDFTAALELSNEYSGFAN